MARVNVFLPAELLAAMDAEAANNRIGRSAFVQSALTRYLEDLRVEREATLVRREMDEACRGMDALAQKLGSWDPVPIIREFRENRAVGVHERATPYRAIKKKPRR